MSLFVIDLLKFIFGRKMFLRIEKISERKR